MGLGPCLTLSLGLGLCWATPTQASAVPAAQPDTADDASAAPRPAGLAWPELIALGAAAGIGPAYAGSSGMHTGWVPHVVARWGKLTISNGGPLASRAGETAEGGVVADLFSRERWSLTAGLRLDQGRKSSDIARLRGLHDIAPHLRGRLQLGWQLHPQWELSALWRADLSGRQTGNSLDVTALHEWRPEFLNHTRWRVSMGVTAEWLDARRANLVHGVTEEDAQRSAFAAYRLNAGLAGVGAFVNARRDFEAGWVAYGSVGLQQLVGQAGAGPLAAQRTVASVTAGLGRRF